MRNVYTKHGFPWFELYDENRGDVPPPDRLREAKTVSDRDKEKGKTGWATNLWMSLRRRSSSWIPVRLSRAAVYLRPQEQRNRNPKESNINQISALNIKRRIKGESDMPRQIYASPEPFTPVASESVL